jgi:endonuclease VIII
VPEGDTVWNTARVLRRALVGGRLTGTDFRVPRLAAVGAASAGLAGWTVLESASRGKHLLLRLAEPASAPPPEPASAPTGDPETPSAPDGGRRLTLHSHLRMDGAWRVYAPGERWAARPAHLIRVVLRTADAVAVGYHLHDLALLPSAEEESLVGHLGPDLLGPDWDPAEAVRRLSARPDLPIADALLDQRNLAGIGNLYKAEVLFLRGVWPWTPVRQTPDLPGLVGLAQRLLAANRGRWAQSTTGSLRRGETSHVYGRRGQPCRRCGSPIRMLDGGPGRPAAEGDRVTFWCPSCQPQPG